MKYYINVNGQQQGPYSVEELAQMGIHNETNVWAEGFPNWLKAGQIDVLKPILINIPPINSAFNSIQQEKKDRPDLPKTWLVESILVTIFCCLPFGVIGIFNSVQVDRYYRQGEYELAEQYSKNAWTWIKAGIFVGMFVIFIVVYYQLTAI